MTIEGNLMKLLRMTAIALAFTGLISTGPSTAADIVGDWGE